MFFFFNQNALLPASAIKSANSYAITIPTGATSSDAVIAPVNTNNAVMFWGGFTTDQTTAVANTYRTRCTLIDSTTVRATRNTSSASYTTTTYAYIVEFDPGFVKSVQYGTVSFGSTAILPPDTDGANSGTYVRAAVSAVDLNNSFVLMLGDSGQSTTNLTTRELYALELRDSLVTGGQAVFAQRGGSTVANNKTVSFCVVELQPGIIKSNQSILTTLSSGNTQDTATLPASVDAANSILINNGCYTTTSGNWTDYLYNKRLTDGSTITYSRKGTVTDARNLRDVVIEFNSGILTRNQQTLDAFSGSSDTQSITAVDTNSAFLLQNGFSSDGTTNPSTLFSAVELTNATTVTSYKGDAATAAETAATVVGL